MTRAVLAGAAISSDQAHPAVMGTLTWAERLEAATGGCKGTVAGGLEAAIGGTAGWRETEGRFNGTMGWEGETGVLLSESDDSS
jgi:hypothetical protein